MKKMNKQKLVYSLNLMIGAIGAFLILLGIFSFLRILDYLVLLLTIIGIIIFVWRLLAERK